VDVRANQSGNKKSLLADMVKVYKMLRGFKGTDEVK